MLHQNIINKLAEKCCNIKQFYQWSQIFKLTDENLQTMMKRLLYQRLEKLNIEPNKFCDQLYQNQCILSGSFPLQCILGEEWEKYDIDIFTSNINTKPYRYYFRSKEYTYDLEAIEYYLYKDLWEPMKNTNEEPPMHLRAHNFFPNYTNVFYVNTYHLVKIDIQLIVVDKNKYKDIKDYINQFDIDVCKMMFDGKKFYYKNWNDIIRKKSNYVMYIDLQNHDNEYGRYLRTIDRIKKYKTRGFKFYEPEYQITKNIIDLYFRHKNQNINFSDAILQIKSDFKWNIIRYDDDNKWWKIGYYDKKQNQILISKDINIFAECDEDFDQCLIKNINLYINHFGIKYLPDNIKKKLPNIFPKKTTSNIAIGSRATYD